MNHLITIYHGSNQIIETPAYGKGKRNNDFGLGFYCTESLEMAMEWGVSGSSDGYANCYVTYNGVKSNKYTPSTYA